MNLKESLIALAVRCARSISCTTPASCSIVSARVGVLLMTDEVHARNPNVDVAVEYVMHSVNEDRHRRTTMMNHELTLTTEAVAAACCHPLLHLSPDLHVDCESDSTTGLAVAAAAVATTAHVTAAQESMSCCVLVAVAVASFCCECRDLPLPSVTLT